MQLPKTQLLTSLTLITSISAFPLTGSPVSALEHGGDSFALRSEGLADVVAMQVRPVVRKREMIGRAEGYEIVETAKREKVVRREMVGRAEGMEIVESEEGGGGWMKLF